MRSSSSVFAMSPPASVSAFFAFHHAPAPCAGAGPSPCLRKCPPSFALRVRCPLRAAVLGGASVPVCAPPRVAGDAGPRRHADAVFPSPRRTRRRTPRSPWITGSRPSSTASATPRAYRRMARLESSLPGITYAMPSGEWLVSTTPMIGMPSFFASGDGDLVIADVHDEHRVRQRVHVP